MGADGGISWLYVKKKEDLQRVYNLLEIFRINSSFRYETSEWLHNNDLGPCAVLIPYGTDMDDKPSAREISEILSSIKKFGPEAQEDITFEEMALDMATCPEWQMYQLSELQKCVLNVCSWSVYYDYAYPWRRDRYNSAESKDSKRTQDILEGIPDLEEFRNMSILSWAKELKEKLLWEDFHSAETWT